MVRALRPPVIHKFSPSVLPLTALVTNLLPGSGSWSIYPLSFLWVGAEDHNDLSLLLECYNESTSSEVLRVRQMPQFDEPSGVLPVGSDTRIRTLRK